MRTTQKQKILVEWFSIVIQKYDHPIVPNQTFATSIDILGISRVFRCEPVSGEAISLETRKAGVLEIASS
jgi:hypothetical protein